MSLRLYPSLSRLWQSIPLTGLEQGATLTIRSRAAALLPATLNVTIRPGWREDGLVELRQGSNGTTAAACNVSVRRLADLRTSLGRLAPHFALDIHPGGHGALPFNDAKPTPVEVIPRFTTSQHPSKIILDNGTILNADSFKTSTTSLRRVDYHDGITHWTRDQKSHDAPLRDNRTENDDAPSSRAAAAATMSGTAHLTIFVPEKLNLDCDICGTIDVTRQTRRRC
jgi:hypothetical protein